MEQDKKHIFDLEIGDLFSFKPSSPVYMISYTQRNYIEYKAYSDGKIRCILKGHSNLEREVFLRSDFDLQFEKKWFVAL